MTREYTVVLLRPESVSLGSVEDDTYIGFVTAKDVDVAVAKAQREAFAEDKKDGLDPKGPTDYRVLAVFSGHAEVVKFGWQL